MNILFISPWFPYPPDNGSKVRIYNHLKTLSQQHEVRLISFVRDGEQVDQKALDGICRLEAKIPWREFNPTSWKSLVGIFSPTPRSIVDTYSPKMSGQLKRSIRQELPDLIIASEMATAIYGGKKLKIPSILDEMQLGFYYQIFSNAKSPFSKMRKKLYLAKVRSYTKYLVNQYDACTVASETERELFSQVVDQKDRIHVIPNGVDLVYNQPGMAKPHPHTLVYNGKLTYSANYDAMSYFLRDIFPNILVRVPETILTITGSVQDVDISQLSVNDHVIFSGFLPDIRPAVAEAWACVVPLRQGGGTRLKILEAMALGTPVIATSKAAEGLSVTPGMNILLADTPEEFSVHTIQLLNNYQLRCDLSKNGREFVEKNYDWDTIGSSFERLIGYVINHSKPRGM
jgi:polysaccharide biosynthesis protein PslH